MKLPFYVIRANRKDRKNAVIDGISESGEISPQGVVEHIEDWEGRTEVKAGPSTIHYVYFKSTGELRKKTLQELIDEGLFYVGHGPVGIQIRR